MRSTMVVVALVAACDGNTSQMMPDGGVDSDDEPMVDADLGINGTWRDTYISVSGTTSQPVCSTAPIALVVDPTTAAVTPYTGMCKGDGSFRIAAPGNLGTYYLRVQGALYETTKHAGLDLSTDKLGRHDVAGVTAAKLSFNMSNLESWSTGDVLMAFAPNIGYAQFLSFTSGGPSNGSTTMTGEVAWNGYKVDAARQDALQIVQLSEHTTSGGLAYLSLDRTFNVPTFTMGDNSTNNVLGAFFPPQLNGVLSLSVDAASFDTHRLAANPNTSLRTIAGNAYAAASPDVIASPSLISFVRDSSTASTLAFGSLAYGDPFEATWSRFVKIQQAFQVPYTWNGVQGVYSAMMTRTMTKTEAQAGTITAQLSPAKNPKLNGVDAFTATNISPVPVVSWEAPVLGTPTDYEVQVYEVQVSGQALKFISTLRLTTKQTSVRIPAGYLLGQRQYMFVIRARIRDTIDMYTTPLRAGTTSSSADVLTALVTTDS
jgi:hypothetical protein